MKQRIIKIVNYYKGIRGIIMVIKDIQIRGFTVFKEIEINFCEGINIILGGNGTGKTQLLKFMCALYETANEKFSRLKSFLQKYPITDINTTLEVERLRFFLECFSYNRMSSFVRFDIQESMELPPGWMLLEDSPFMSLKIKDDIIHTISYEIVANQENPNKKIGKTIDKLTNSHNNKSVFIPAKEILTHANLEHLGEIYGTNFPFDSTYLHIIKLARNLRLKDTPDIARNILNGLESIMQGRVDVMADGSFVIDKNDGKKIHFSMEADGYKKFGLLWQLLMNGSINKNTVLFWDEPENSINPEHIPVLIDILLELQRNGLQIFISTHNYNIMNYINVRRERSDKIKYICLKKVDDYTICETADNYEHLNHNPIVEGELKMYDDAIRKGLML